MKKLFLVTVISLLFHCINAQTFDGIKLSKTAENFVNCLQKYKGYVLIEENSLQKEVEGKISTVYVEPTTKGYICYIENNVYCNSSWKDIQKEYYFQLSNLKNIYGIPKTDSSYFAYGYYHHRMDELAGIKNGLCNYYATWILKDLTIYLSIQYMDYQDRFVINIEYINTNNC